MMNYPPDPNPISDLPPSQPRYLPLPTRKPILTYVLLAIIVLVWLAGLVVGQETLIELGAIYTPYILGRGEIWRLFTGMFLHGSLLHLFFNSYALFIFGLQIERIYGPARFLTIYLLSGLFGSLASFALHDIVLAVGASGAIFGVIGAHLAYLLLYRDKFGPYGRQSLINTVVIVAINIFFGLSVPRIDNLAHMGGLVAGFALGFGLVPRYRLVDQYTTQPRLVDTVTLVKRLWVPVLAAGLWVGGLMLALAWR